MAWYDERTGDWEPVPAIYDMANGTVTGLVEYFSLCAVIRQAGMFTDLAGPEYAWARETITRLAMDGVITGVGENRFEPNRDISRAELTKPVWSRASKPNLTQRAPPASTTSAGRWYAPYVTVAARQGLVRGVGEGRFLPDAPMSRQEMAALLVRAEGLEGEVGASGPEALERFAHAGDAAAWAVPYLAVAVKKGLLQGREGGRLAPAAPPPGRRRRCCCTAS